jgi:hypothetical protein
MVLVADIEDQGNISLVGVSGEETLHEDTSEVAIKKSFAGEK